MQVLQRNSSQVGHQRWKVSKAMAAGFSQLIDLRRCGRVSTGGGNILIVQVSHFILSVAFAGARSLFLYVKVLVQPAELILLQWSRRASPRQSRALGWTCNHSIEGPVTESVSDKTRLTV